MSAKPTARFFDIVAGGRMNTPEEWHEYLEAFHAELPHANELFTLLRTFSEKTSYGLLASATAELKPKHILDVGCGDGNLIDDLLELLPPDARVYGIDSSDAEIAIARRRFASDDRVSLAVGDARKLPYADGSFDCVVAHQFLNLFPDVHPVLSEIARVLKPTGDLLFVANRSLRGYQKAHWITMHEAAMAALMHLHPQFVWPKMGDMRIYNEDGVADILAESTHWDMGTLTTETFVTSATMAPDRIAAIYNRLYLFGTVPEKDVVLAAVEKRAKELATSEGLVEVGLPFRLVRIKPTPT